MPLPNSLKLKFRIVNIQETASEAEKAEGMLEGGREEPTSRLEVVGMLRHKEMVGS